MLIMMYRNNIVKALLSRAILFYPRLKGVMKMYKILKKRYINRTGSSVEMVIEAPNVARNCSAGQFVILMPNERSERIPLTISDYDREKGTITIIFQPVGKTTKQLSYMYAGDSIYSFAGPMGKPTVICKNKKVAVIGGGVGCAIAYPVSKAMYRAGNFVDMIAGYKDEDTVFLAKEMARESTRFFLMTDDGSMGEKGFTTHKLKELISLGNRYDEVFVIGPTIMMKLICDVTKVYGLKTIVSMNPIMIDGTGMCGGCRFTVDGETKFACVDGPEFDGHLVDWDEVLKRNSFYSEEEKNIDMHYCNLVGGVRSEK